jgi:hypothetical protein
MNSLFEEYLIAYYPFDMNANDYSGSNLNAKVHGPKIDIDRFNKIGSYKFDGIKDYIEVENPYKFHFSNESLTISMWVKIKDNENTYRTFIVMSNKDLIPRIEIMKSRSGNIDGRIYIQVAQDGKNRSTAVSIKSGSNLPKDEWMHIAGVVDYEKLKLRLFINGAVQQAVDLIKYYKMPESGDMIVRFGETSSSLDHWNSQRHNGSIDDVRVYSRAISNQKILELYNDH